MVRKKKPKGPKRVLFTLIPPDQEPYKILKKVVEKWHPHLEEARIALAWKVGGWKPDRDGIMKLGQAKKASDLDREMKPYDFVILLSQTGWDELSKEQRLALVDHEASHCEVSRDERTGEVRLDDRGRKVYRMRHHDIAEFRAVVKRHGLYTRDLEEFVKVAVEQKNVPLFKVVSDKEKDAG
jgi:hypothetical protein